MKQIISTFLLAFLLIICVSCSTQARIELGFTATDVKDIEVFHLAVPAQAEQMVVTSEADIEEIITLLTSIKVKESRLEPTVGTTTTSFRFNLKDDTNFEIIYVSHGADEGIIKSSYAFDYKTNADIESVWNNYDYEKASIDEKELPIYEQ